jgi:hypothetical protein
VANFLQQYLYISQRDTVVAISIWILPRMSTLLWDLVSITTKWLTRATEFGCHNIVAILQHLYILLQYMGYIATKHKLITTKLNHGNMRGLLPQTWKWWKYCVLLQQNVVVAIKIVAIEWISCSANSSLRDTRHQDPYFWKFASGFHRGDWYVSNVSIIFDAPCLFLYHLPIVSLHLVALLCIFRN